MWILQNILCEMIKFFPMPGLTLTVITPKVNGLNYGETLGNVITLKKVTLGDGTQKTYISDKAIKYELRHQGKQRFGWQLLDKKLVELVEGCLIKEEKKGKKGKKAETVLDVDKFAQDLIENYHEFDLFGGLFTKLKTKDDAEVKLKGDYESVKRIAPVKVSYGFSIEPFQGDMDFMNNIDAYNRYIKYLEKKDAQVIVNTETHLAHYYYTVTVDLDRIGVWEDLEGNTTSILTNKEKKERVIQLLELIKTLSRQIKGRWESLAPIFVIGGVFEVKNPFFIDSIKAREENGKLYLEVEPIEEAIELIPEEERNKVVCGLLKGHFVNEDEIIKKLSCKSVSEAFEELKKQIEEVYGKKKETEKQN